MQLRTVDGKLTLGSVYKLIFWSWLLSWGAFMGAVVVLLILFGLVTGEMYVNGEVVQGRGSMLVSMLPLIGLAPFVITLHAFMFAGFLTFGAWLYRLRRPLTVAPSPMESS